MAEGSAITSVGGFTIKASTGTASNGITTTIYVVSRNGVQGFANDPSGIYAAAQSVQQRSFGGVVEDVNDWVGGGGAQALARQSEAQASAAPVTTAPAKFGEQVDTAKTTEPPLEQINESDDDNQVDNTDDGGFSPYGEENEPFDSSAYQFNQQADIGSRTNNGIIDNTATAKGFSQKQFSSGSSGGGDRTNNPLADLSSYTYNLSFYMLPKDVYNALAESDFQNVSGSGALLIAQSGGVNNSGSEQKAPGFADVDYFIDNLKIKTLTMAANAGPFNTFEFSFDIVEPIGFSFVQRLTNLAKSNIENFDAATSPLATPYLIGIKFYGYDEYGNNIGGAMYERYYPIFITSLKFSIGAQATVYKFNAVIYSYQIGAGVKFGTVSRPIRLIGTTVKDFLEGGSGNDIYGLIEDLNKYEEEKVKNKTQQHPNKFKIEFKGEGIQDSKLEQDDFKNTGSKKTPDTQPKNTVTASVKNKSADPTKKSINIIQGTTAISVIDKIIGQSTYIRDAMKIKMKEKNFQQQEQNGGGKPADWYSVDVKVKMLERDTTLKEWSYEITYVITTHKIPYVKSSFKDMLSPYEGPHKIYDYIFTGKNKEILEYNQTFNTLYYINSTDAKPKEGSEPVTADKNQSISLKPAPTMGGDGTSGSNNGGNEAENSFKISLYSPGDQAKANIKILGDPDYLDQSIGKGTGQGRTGNDSTINYNYGQVFIEIRFKGADDYNLNTGTLNLQDNIKFWEYPAGIEPEGIIYMVVSAKSEFVRGTFTQDLELIIAQFPEKTTGTSTAGSSSAGTPAGEGRSAAAGRPAPTTGDRSSYASDTGAQDPSTLTSLKQISASLSDTGAQDPSQFQRFRTDSFGLSKLVPSSAGGTQDDDAVGAGDYDAYNEGREILGP